MFSKWKPQSNQICQLSFEEYLQPAQKKPVLFRKRMQHLSKRRSDRLGPTQRSQKHQKPPLQLKLLQHPVLSQPASPSHLQQLYAKLKQKLSIASRKLRSCLHPLPACLTFLHARKDDKEECRRKTGFEIYCELSSIHGFANFIGASTWQRVFWCLIVCLATLWSAAVVMLWYLMSVEAPTIIYAESTTDPAWRIPFPAVTLCNFNRISKRRAEEVAKKFDKDGRNPFSQQEMLQLFRYAIHSNDFASPSKDHRRSWRRLDSLLDHNNYTLRQLLHDISPSCTAELLRCKWRGVDRHCYELFSPVATTQGKCCSFNFNRNALKQSRVLEASGHLSDIAANFYVPEYTASCGARMGLTLLLDPQLEDYAASRCASGGYRLFLHSVNAYPVGSGQQRQLVVHARSDTHVSVMPSRTYVSEYVNDWSVSSRRCYLPEERALSAFGVYTQSNCLLECRAREIHRKCGCLPAQWRTIEPLGELFLACSDAKQLACLAVNRSIRHRLTVSASPQRQGTPICDCLPQCSFNQYAYTVDEATLQPSFAVGFLKNITIQDHIVLHVFYADLTAEKLRLDMRENWLSFIGTFGGIIGLHMGYSFISGFEIIFFVFIRPACNWLTRQQIRCRLRRKAKQQVAAIAGGGVV